MKRENFKVSEIEGNEHVMKISPQHKKIYAIRFNPETREISFDYTVPTKAKKKK